MGLPFNHSKNSWPNLRKMIFYHVLYVSLTEMFHTFQRILMVFWRLIIVLGCKTSLGKLTPIYSFNFLKLSTGRFWQERPVPPGSSSKISNHATNILFAIKANQNYMIWNNEFAKTFIYADELLILSINP